MIDFFSKDIFKYKKLVIVLASFFILSFSSLEVFSRDRQEGWVWRRDKDGKLIKVPRKQYFEFGGKEAKGSANIPGVGVLGKRPSRRKRLLIPVRKSFRQDSLESMGYSGK